VGVQGNWIEDPPAGSAGCGGILGTLLAKCLVPEWQGNSAPLPSERPDQPTYNEAFVFDGERMIPAVLVEAPWLRRLQPNGEDVSFTLRTKEGEVRIEGENDLVRLLAGGHSEFAPALQQAGVRYRWDGEESFGMMERSIPVDPT